ncbi:hypothetical protein BDV19DRAFT_386778 [Aspergillus venezuelensis]
MSTSAGSIMRIAAHLSSFGSVLLDLECKAYAAFITSTNINSAIFPAVIVLFSLNPKPIQSKIHFSEINSLPLHSSSQTKFLQSLDAFQTHEMYPFNDLASAGAANGGGEALPK